jgi:hypothetical protein
MNAPHLNLLSTEKRSKLEQLIKFLFTKNILETVILFCSLIALTLLWASLTLSDQLTTAVDASNVTSPEYSAYGQDVAKINYAIRGVNLAGTGVTSTTPKLIELIQKIPADIKLSSLDFDRKSNTLTLAGTAKTRDALLTLQDVLHTISWIDKSSAPVSQLFTATDVTFEIKSTLKGFSALRPDAPNTPKSTVNPDQL